MHRNAPLSPMKEGARVHHSYGSYAPSTYGSYEPRRANPSTAFALPCMFTCVSLSINIQGGVDRESTAGGQVKKDFGPLPGAGGQGEGSPPAVKSSPRAPVYLYREPRSKYTGWCGNSFTAGGPGEGRHNVGAQLARRARLGLGRMVALYLYLFWCWSLTCTLVTLCTTAHPLYKIITDIFGTALSEATM
jgi:hypothetical protein